MEQLCDCHRGARARRTAATSPPTDAPLEIGVRVLEAVSGSRVRCAVTVSAKANNCSGARYVLITPAIGNTYYERTQYQQAVHFYGGSEAFYVPPPGSRC